MIKIIAQEVESQGFKIQYDKYTRINWTWYFARTNQDTNNYYKSAIDSLTESGLIWKDDNISLNLIGSDINGIEFLSLCLMAEFIISFILRFFSPTSNS